MAKTYNKWTEREKDLLLYFVIDGIKEGKKIKSLLETFATTYLVSAGSVSNMWQKLAFENKELVDLAKDYWYTYVKPELDAQAKEMKARNKHLAKVMKANEVLRKQWGKQKERKAKERTKLIATGRKPHPRQQGSYIKVDAQGIVVSVEKVV